MSNFPLLKTSSQQVPGGTIPPLEALHRIKVPSTQRNNLSSLNMDSKNGSQNNTVRLERALLFENVLKMYIFRNLCNTILMWGKLDLCISDRKSMCPVILIQRRTWRQRLTRKIQERKSLHKMMVFVTFRAFLDIAVNKNKRALALLAINLVLPCWCAIQKSYRASHMNIKCNARQ